MRQISTFITLTICEMILASLSYAAPPEEIYAEDKSKCQECMFDEARLFSSQPSLLGNKLDEISPGRRA